MEEHFYIYFFPILFSININVGFKANVFNKESCCDIVAYCYQLHNSKDFSLYLFWSLYDYHSKPMDWKRSSSINPWLTGTVYRNNCLQLTCNKISQNDYFPKLVSLLHSLHQTQNVVPLPFCFIVCCHSCFLQQQHYLFYFFLSLNCRLCSTCFNTSLFFTFLE